MSEAKPRNVRKDRPVRERAAVTRAAPSTRCAVALLAVAALLGVLAAPASAATGGATTIASSDARQGRGIVFTTLRIGGATWYGPGFYGDRTACGQILRPRTVGVAHRRLPCGTPVKFLHRGRRIVTRVIDRGPYAGGMVWDLTNGARRLLRFHGSGPIRYAIGRRTGKPRPGARRAGARIASLPR